MIERQFGYEVIEDVSVKGKPLDRYDDQNFFMAKWVDTEEENFPEAKSGLTD